MAEEGQELEVSEAFIIESVKQAMSNAGLSAWPVEPEPYAGALPAVTYQYVGGIDEEPSDSGDILMTIGRWRVIARNVGKTIGVTRLAARAIHAALHRVKGSNDYGDVYWSRRERPVRMAFAPGTETEIIHGGDYVISVKGT